MLTLAEGGFAKDPACEINQLFYQTSPSEEHFLS